MENFRSACLRMSSEICTFVKCIVCMFSGLNTPKLQTSGLTRKGRPFFTTYQTHFLRQYQGKIIETGNHVSLIEKKVHITIL